MYFRVWKPELYVVDVSWHARFGSLSRRAMTFICRLGLDLRWTLIPFPQIQIEHLIDYRSTLEVPHQ